MGLDDKLGASHIPQQKLGRKMDAVAERYFAEEEAAATFFQLVKYRLLDVNRWGELAGTALSSFQLTDDTGNDVDRLAQKGDYFKIDIPGPGAIEGGGFDWVKVEDIIEDREEGAELLSMRVWPSRNPNSRGLNTAHFLTEEASSTFQVKRVGKLVCAEEHGRNEQPNTDTAQVVDNIRNAVVGFAAIFGFSYPQWKLLVKNLLADADERY